MHLCTKLFDCPHGATYMLRPDGSAAMTSGQAVKHVSRHTVTKSAIIGMISDAVLRDVAWRLPLPQIQTLRAVRGRPWLTSSTTMHAACQLKSVIFHSYDCDSGPDTKRVNPSTRMPKEPARASNSPNSVTPLDARMHHRLSVPTTLHRTGHEAVCGRHRRAGGQGR